MVTLTESASLTVNGINPQAGPGLVLLANPSLAVAGSQMGDYVAQTFTVNPLTAATDIDLGKINLGRVLWIQTAVPVTVTITQNAADQTLIVDSLLLFNGQFTAVKLSNPSASVTANVAVVILGDRPPVGLGPGVY